MKNKTFKYFHKGDDIRDFMNFMESMIIPYSEINPLHGDYGSRTLKNRTKITIEIYEE